MIAALQIFTALHGMSARYSYEKAVCPNEALPHTTKPLVN